MIEQSDGAAGLRQQARRLQANGPGADDEDVVHGEAFAKKRNPHCYLLDGRSNTGQSLRLSALYAVIEAGQDQDDEQAPPVVFSTEVRPVGDTTTLRS
ncbi:hypothetical protein D9M71_311780 [compost metagenome]